MRAAESGLHAVTAELATAELATTEQGATAEQEWAEQTRRVLTRDLLLQADRAQPAERHSLLFRALHLNLPLISAAANGLGLTPQQRSDVEHRALDALAEALSSHDPYGEEDLADRAAILVEQAVAEQLPVIRQLTDTPAPA